MAEKWTESLHPLVDRYLNKMPHKDSFDPTTDKDQANFLLKLGMNKFKDELEMVSSVQTITRQSRRVPSATEPKSGEEPQHDLPQQLQGKMLHEVFPKYFNAPKKLTIVAEMNIDELVNEFELDLEHELFDDLLVASPEGEVLYQEDASRFRISNVKTLLESNDPSPSPDTSSQEKEERGPPNLQLPFI